MKHLYQSNKKIHFCKSNMSLRKTYLSLHRKAELFQPKCRPRPERFFRGHSFPVFAPCFQILRIGSIDTQSMHPPAVPSQASFKRARRRSDLGRPRRSACQPSQRAKHLVTAPGHPTRNALAMHPFSRCDQKPPMLK